MGEHRFESFLQPGAEAVLLQLGFAQPVALLGFAGCVQEEPRSAATGLSQVEVVRETPGRRSWRLEAADGGTYYLKQYAPGAGRKGKIARWAAPARLEAQCLRDMAGAGLPVPELVCACWLRSSWPGAACGRAGGAGPGAVLMRGLPGRGVDELLPLAAPDLCRDFFLERLLPFVRRLHSLDFYHRDLYSGHFLAQSLAQQPALVDVARVRRSAGPWGRLRVKDLAALLFSFRPYVSDWTLLRAYVSYIRGLPQAAGSGRGSRRQARRRLAQRVQRRARRMARHVPNWDVPAAQAAELLDSRM